MAQSGCATFLQWALPRLGLTWPGFRRVHHQVCKRIGRRLQALRLPDPAAYRVYLETHPEEWAILDSYCRISVSRLVRDCLVFMELGRVVIPALVAAAHRRGEHRLRCWSAGCASGEEPYSLSILWRTELAPRFPTTSFTVLATDVDARLLEWARAARYRRSSLREVPPAWLEAAFERRGHLRMLRPAFREGVEFVAQDIRRDMPPGPFDLILCRNLVFTYFDAPSQRRTLARMLAVLRPEGALVIALRERLPGGATGLEPWRSTLGVYRKSAEPQLDLELAARTTAAPRDAGPWSAGRRAGILLWGGSARPAFGGGEVTAPIEIYLAGRATRTFRDQVIPVDELAVEGSRAWLRRNLHALDPERHVTLHPLVRPCSADLVDVFLRQLWGKPGEDVKVLGIRRGARIDLTVAAALIGRFVSTLADHVEKRERVRTLALDAAHHTYAGDVHVAVNTADVAAEGRIYLTVTGTSGEAGDDGQAGRGNRANGLITPYRPMTLEAAAGKNPATHVGKLYRLPRAASPWPSSPSVRASWPRNVCW
jgi:chemotaxis protein methyltransferase CheR